jgi:hypothetical protein
MSGGFTNPTEASAKQNDHKGKLFIARVKDNNDPLKIGRVRITIPKVIEGSGEELPWAIPLTNDLESIKVPNNDALVYVMLQNGDEQFPVYFGPHWASSTPIPSLLQTNYPNRYGSVDSVGNHWFVDKTSGVVELQHKSGTKITVSDSGDVTLQVVGSITSQASNWSHQGDLTVQGLIKASIDVKGLNISLVQHLHPGVDTGGGVTQPPI